MSWRWAATTGGDAARRAAHRHHWAIEVELSDSYKKNYCHDTLLALAEDSAGKSLIRRGGKGAMGKRMVKRMALCSCWCPWHHKYFVCYMRRHVPGKPEKTIWKSTAEILSRGPHDFEEITVVCIQGHKALWDSLLGPVWRRRPPSKEPFLLSVSDQTQEGPFICVYLINRLTWKRWIYSGGLT